MLNSTYEAQEAEYMPYTFDGPVQFMTNGAAALDVTMSEGGVISRGTHKYTLPIRLLSCERDVCFQITLRSSWGSKGLWVHPGIIDSDYRGVISACITNTTETEFTYHAGDRICQLLPLIIRTNDYYQKQANRVGGWGSTTCPPSEAVHKN